MEDPNKIDDLLQRRLYDAEVAPPAFVWPNVEQVLRKRKRRFFLWFFSGLGITLAGLGTIWLLQEAPIAAVTDRTTIENREINPAVSQGNAGQVIVPEPAIAEHAPDADANANVSFSNKAPDVRQAKARPLLKAFPGLGEAGPAADPAPGASVSADAKKAEAQLDEVLNPGIAVLRSNPLNITETDKPTDRANLAVSALSRLLPEPLAYSRNISLPALAPIKKYKPNKKGPKTCYDFNKNPNVWLLDVYAGPSFGFKELNTNDPEYQNYLRQRQDTEHRDWAFNAGVRATLLFDRHFMLRAGLHYEQMTEIFEYAEPNSLEIDVTRRWDAMSGIWVEETTGVRYGDAFFKAYNRLGMLDIPLQAGMELRKGRSGFNINAGLSFNVLFWKRGAILTPQGVPRYFTPDNVNSVEVFRPRTGLSAMGSIQWFYHLQPRLRVFAEPYFRQIVQPINVEGHPIGQRYGVGGIRLGLTKILD